MTSKIESRLLEDITASIPGALYQFMVRPDGSRHLNFISKGVETLFGVTQEDACRDLAVLDQCIVDEDRSSHRQSIDYAVRNLLPWRHEYRVRTGSGTFKWIRTTALPQSLPDGRTLWNGILSDITDQKQMETALRESEQRFRILAEGAFEGIAITENGRFTEVNRQFAHMIGYDKTELIGIEVGALIPPEHRDQVTNNIRQGIESWIEHTMIRKDGSLIIVETHGRNTTYRDKPVRITALQDITERRRAEKLLQEEKEKFSLAFQAMPSVLVITTLAEGRYIEVNEAFERVMGYRRNEVIGRCSLDFNTWQNPKDRAMVVRKVAAGEKVRDLEFAFRSKSGAGLVGLYSAEIITIGEERCLLSLVNDITARKNAEEELRRSEERYRHLYEETPVMLHSIDQNGQLVSVSNYWLDTLGYDSSEVLGRRISEFLAEETRRYTEEVVLPEFFRTGSCREVPYRVVKKNGEIMDVLLSATAERDDEGKAVRSLAVMIDVTERKRLDEKIDILYTDLAARAAELENANREMEAFSYSVSHDLRSPLTVIGGYCQLIQKSCGHYLDTQCQEYLETVYGKALSMEQLIDALLKFSILIKTELHRENVDLSRIADLVAAELALTDTGRRVSFRIAEGITVNGDANLLRVVLENLLGNAWKYTGKQEEAVIEFGMMEIEGIATCFVRDNGPGFEMEHADKLFIPFHRLHRIEAGGHGIGLTTVERIIKRHGGKVWAEGEPGKGATFYFTL
jgi:PAS domain S-box-containing protein